MARFHSSDAFIRGLMGPVGSGKSVAMCMEIIRRATEQRCFQDTKIRRSKWGVIRNTYVELKSTTIRTWLEWVPETLGKIKWDAPITHVVRFPLPDGTTVELEVLFVSFDRPDDIKKLKSLDLTGLFINEVCEEPKAVLDMGAARVGRFPAKRDGGTTWCGVIMDTNAMDTDHWYYSLAEKDLTTERGRKIWQEIHDAELVMRNEGMLRENQSLMEFFKQPPALSYEHGLWVPNTGAENIKNLNGGFAYYLRQVAGKSHEWINTYLAGNYGKVVDGKPVYYDYVESVHAQGREINPVEGLPIIIGLDYGLTPAAALIQCDLRGKVRVVGELCSDGMGIQRFLSDALKPYLATNFSGFEFKCTGDPAGKNREGNEKTCEEYVIDAGFEYEPAKTNAPIARIEAVSYFLNRRDGFEMDLSCQMIRKGFAGGYHYKRVQVLGDERFKEEPDKNMYSHIHDALQYACLFVGGVQAVRAREDERPEWMKEMMRHRNRGGFMAR
jgi:hypothetical protein